MASDTIKLIESARFKEAHGALTEMKVYQVPKTRQYPLGYRYSLYYLQYDKVLVGYDNHFPKGPHKHINGKEYYYEFSNLETLLKDFCEDKKKFCEVKNDAS